MSKTEVITAKEAAIRLGVSDRTIRNHAKSGEIPSVMVGRLRRFFWPELLDHYIANTDKQKNTPQGAKG